jgi:hypothetical protein
LLFLLKLIVIYDTINEINSTIHHPMRYSVAAIIVLAIFIGHAMLQPYLMQI